MTRVLWLVKGLGRGGAERLLVQTLTHLDRTRFDVEVAYLLPWKDAYVADLESLGATVHCLGSGGVRVAWMASLRRLLAQGQYDIVHTHSPVPAVAARLLAGGSAPPVLVHTEHNTWDRFRGPTRVANSLTYHRNRHVLAVSDAVAATCRPRRLVRRRWPTVETLVHGIDPDRMEAPAHARARVRADLGIEPDAVVVGSIASFTPKKDHASLLEAWRRVVDAQPDAHLVLVGAGPTFDTTRRLAHTLDLVDSVTFVGLRDDIPELMASWDVFTLASRHEGLPIALLEAMAAGLACVATAAGGVPDVLDRASAGHLVPVGDAGALAEALSLAVGSTEHRAWLSAGALQRVQDFHCAPAVARIEALYDEVLADTRAARR